MLKHKIQTIFEALLYIMLTYWLIDAFFAFNKYDWMLESGGNICSIPSVSGEDRWNLNLSGVDLRQLRILTWQHNIDIAAQQRRIRGELGNQHFPS